MSVRETIKLNPSDLKYLLIDFNLIKGSSNEDFTLYASHSRWNSEEDFVNWTKSESFRMAHKNTGQHKGIYLGHPDFEGFKVII